MQIEISTTQELGLVMKIASQNEVKNNSRIPNSPFVRLFFVGSTDLQMSTTFEDAMRSLNEAGVRLVAEVVEPTQMKTKKKSKKPR